MDTGWGSKTGRLLHPPIWDLLLSTQVVTWGTKGNSFQMAEWQLCWVPLRPKEEHLCDAVLPIGWVSRLCLSFWAMSAKSGLWQVSESKYLAESKNCWWAWSPLYHQYMRMAFFLSPYCHRTLSMKTLPIWWPKMLLKSPFPLVSCEGKHFSCTYWPFPFLPGNAINDFLNFKDWLCHELETIISVVIISIIIVFVIKKIYIILYPVVGV